MEMRTRWQAAAIGGLALLLAGAVVGPVAAQDQSHEITWLFSRPTDGPVIKTVTEVADLYAQSHPGFKLNQVTTPDRPSYLQKLETLAAANQLPELFDTDATPFAQKLRDAGHMLDVGAKLDEWGLRDKFRAAALGYQMFDDGSVYMLPLEMQQEWFWYNTAAFEKAGVSVPEKLEDIPAMCQPLRDAGYVPLAVDGVDGWPLMRMIALIPFRLTGNDYVKQLKTGAVSLGDEPGRRAAQFVYDLGQNGCFQEGFSADDYVAARNLYASGQAAMYYMGTWEVGTFTDPSLDPEVAKSIDFFTLPTTDGATTQPNEYIAPSGIGMAVNAKKYDPVVEDFIKFLIAEYPARYAATQQFSPLVAPALTEGVSELYTKSSAALDALGPTVGVPWDTQLDPTSNTRMQQELVLLASGEITPDQFIETIDAVIKEEAPRFFGE
jgi:raffinose/stachyose/melibiose transport system substrate-binding protein